MLLGLWNYIGGYNYDKNNVVYPMKIDFFTIIICNPPADKLSCLSKQSSNMRESIYE